jgi:hypothetical protein
MMSHSGDRLHGQPRTNQPRSAGASSSSDRARSPVSQSEASGVDVLSASELLQALTRTVDEEAEPLRKLIADEDSDCMTRDLRAARLEGLEFALRAFRRAEGWEW